MVVPHQGDGGHVVDAGGGIVVDTGGGCEVTQGEPRTNHHTGDSEREEKG